jgi:hypothetical protein
LGQIAARTTLIDLISLISDLTAIIKINATLICSLSLPEERGCLGIIGRNENVSIAPLQGWCFFILFLGLAPQAIDIASLRGLHC